MQAQTAQRQPAETPGAGIEPSAPRRLGQPASVALLPSLFLSGQIQSMPRRRMRRRRAADVISRLTFRSNPPAGRAN